MIYTAGLVLPISSDPIANGAILVRDGFIRAVGDFAAINKNNPNDDVVDFRDAVIMPGLINLHGHLECSAFSELAEETPFVEWLPRIISSSSKMDRSAWLAAARKGVKHYLQAGITCAADISRSGAGLQAMIEAKMPGVSYIEAVAIDESNLAENVVSLLERIKSSQALLDMPWLKVGLSPHSAYTLSESALKACAQIAHEFDLPISIHVAESVEETELLMQGGGALVERLRERLKLEAIEQGGSGKTPVEFLDEAGLITNNTLAAHGVWMSRSDIELLRAKGCSLALCPGSNKLLQTGVAPVRQLLKAGVNLGIGTDSCASNKVIDMFGEARLVYELFGTQQSGVNDSQNGNRRELTPQKIIQMLTIDAASILNMDEFTGSLETDKRADFAIVSLEIGANDDPYEKLLNNADNNSIVATILGGVPVYQHPAQA